MILISAPYTPPITIRCQCDLREHLASRRYRPGSLADRVDAQPFVTERGAEAPRSQGFLDLVVSPPGETHAHAKSQFPFPPQPDVGTHGAGDEIQVTDARQAHGVSFANGRA